MDDSTLDTLKNNEPPKTCDIKNEINWSQKIFLPGVILGTLYILWRICFSIDYHSSYYNIIAAMLLLFTELYSFLMFLSFSFITKQKPAYSQCTATKDNTYYPTVDIFICTYNEGLDILTDTFEGCKNLNYPKKEIYVLDDGKRKEVEKTALELGFKYISRENNIGYKAGNINNALKHSKGDLIAIFDADHIPVSTFLNELVDYFIDEKVAVVQTPQHFYNLDPAQKNLKMYSFLSNEQDLFFRVIEPGMNCLNSTLIAGTNFVIRRQFLEEIGGLPQESITEDMALGIILEGKGLKVHFHDKPLAIGLAPENFKEYIIQRCRWAKGTFQIFLSKHIQKELKNMPFTQKMPYYAGLMYYMLSFPRLICMIMPALFLIFNIKPVITSFWTVMFCFQLGYFSLKIAYFYFIAKKHRNIIFSDLYELCIWYPLISEITKMFLIKGGTKKQKFTVTNKGKLADTKNYELKLILPNIILFIICLTAFFFTYDKFIHIDYKPALYVNLFWNTYNLIMLFLAITIGIEKPDKRIDYRVKVKLNASIKHFNQEIKVKVLNLSKSGALICSTEFFNKGQLFLFNLLNLKNIPVKIINSKKTDQFVYTSIKFDYNSSKFKKEIFNLMFANSDNWN